MPFAEQYDLEAAVDDLVTTATDFDRRTAALEVRGLSIEILQALLPRCRAVRSALEARDVVEAVPLVSSRDLRKWVEEWINEVHALAPSLAVFMDRDDYARSEIDETDLLDSLNNLHGVVMNSWEQLDSDDFVAALSSEPGLLPSLASQFYEGLRSFELALDDHNLWFGIVKRRESAVPIEGEGEEEWRKS